MTVREFARTLNIHPINAHYALLKVGAKVEHVNSQIPLGGYELAASKFLLDRQPKQPVVDAKA